MAHDIPKIERKEKNYDEVCRNCVKSRECWLYGNTICSNFKPRRTKNGEKIVYPQSTNVENEGKKPKNRV